jgi:hypothetical protein
MSAITLISTFLSKIDTSWTDKGFIHITRDKCMKYKMSSSSNATTLDIFTHEVPRNEF